MLSRGGGEQVITCVVESVSPVKSVHVIFLMKDADTLKSDSKIRRKLNFIYSSKRMTTQISPIQNYSTIPYYLVCIPVKGGLAHVTATIMQPILSRPEISSDESVLMSVAHSYALESKYKSNTHYNSPDLLNFSSDNSFPHLWPISQDKIRILLGISSPIFMLLTKIFYILRMLTTRKDVRNVWLEITTLKSMKLPKVKNHIKLSQFINSASTTVISS